tara:strand:+ start:268 stop:1551 length:1284 start_codon:yes stop_codon:yes gene_type:complete
MYLVAFRLWVDYNLASSKPFSQKMPKIIKPLTTASVRSIKVGQEKRDGGGLVFSKLESGKTVARLKYGKPSTGKYTWLTLAKYDGPADLKEARKLADEARALVAIGRDPKVEHLKRNGKTFEFVAMEWLKSRKRIKTDKTLRDRIAALQTHLLAELGSIPMAEIHPSDISPRLIKLINNGTLDLANRLARMTKEISIYAVSSGYIEADKMAGLSTVLGIDGEPTTKRHPSIKPRQLPDLMASVFNASIKIQTRDSILLQLHLMARPGEIVRLKWEDIGEDNITFPAEVMKLPRDHVVPISNQTRRMLGLIRARLPDDCEWVFPAKALEGNYPHLNPETNNKALQRAGWKGRLVAHGMRTLATTCLADDGFDDVLIDLALSHVAGKKSKEVSSSFAHYARSTRLEQRRPMMSRWSEIVSEGIVKGLKL